MFSMFQTSYSVIIQTEHNVIAFQLKNNSSTILHYKIFLKVLEEHCKIFIWKFPVMKILQNIIELFFSSFEKTE